MRKLGMFALLLVLVSFKPETKVVSEADKINWLTLEEAIALQKKEPRKIIMDVYTSWCGPCKMLDKYTFSNSDVISYINKNYYAVKFNAEGNSEVTYNDKTFKNPDYDPEKAKRRNSSHELSRYLGVRAYPTIVYFDEEGKYITGVSSYLKPQQLELYLKMFKNDEHKEMTTQEKFNEYYKAFKPKFKE